jgi:hypothetical protein
MLVAYLSFGELLDIAHSLEFLDLVGFLDISENLPFFFVL